MQVQISIDDLEEEKEEEKSNNLSSYCSTPNRLRNIYDHISLNYNLTDLS